MYFDSAAAPSRCYHRSRLVLRVPIYESMPNQNHQCNEVHAYETRSNEFGELIICFTCSSASFSSNALRKRQLFVLTSRKRCSSSQTDESRRFFDIGRSVARIRLSTAPCGLRFISTNWIRLGENESNTQKRKKNKSCESIDISNMNMQRTFTIYKPQKFLIANDNKKKRKGERELLILWVVLRYIGVYK